MDNNVDKKQGVRAGELPAGILVHGKVISASARLFNKKDGTGKGIKVTHEIATQPGLVIWEQYIEPAQHPEIRIEGDSVSGFPALPMMSDVLLKAGKTREYDKKLVIGDAQVID